MPTVHTLTGEDVNVKLVNPVLTGIPPTTAVEMTPTEKSAVPMGTGLGAVTARVCATGFTVTSKVTVVVA